MIVVPAKYKSSRLEKKNFIPFYNGVSLLQIAVLRSINANCGSVIVSSEQPHKVEDQLVLLPSRLQAKVKIHKRKDSLATDPATVLDVIEDCLNSFPSDSEESVMCVLPTSPFNSSTWVGSAKNLFETNSADRLISISKANKPPFNAWLEWDKEKSCLIESAFPDSPYRQTQSTRCPDAFYSNGCVSILNIQSLRKREFKTTIGYKMPATSSVDIDHYYEFEMAQKMFSDWSSDLDSLSEIF